MCRPAPSSRPRRASLPATVDRSGCICRLLPISHGPFPKLRRVSVHHFTFGGPAQASLELRPARTAHGGLCHEASIQPVTRLTSISQTRVSWVCEGGCYRAF